MSTQATTVEKVTAKQKGLAATRFERLFKSTGSVAIDVLGDYPLLTAISKNDQAAAIAALTALMNKRAEERAAYEAEHPKETPASPTPAA